jgi:hypothetical protein
LNVQKVQKHIDHLQVLHDDLDKQIDEDIKNYKDDKLVSVLKKKKLALKDEIERFKRDLELNSH